jgi:RNA polymerase subunit RPABC4/transcription elongation factor Spt4
MSEEDNTEIAMAECGKCRTIIPLDSESCSNCGVNFGGVSEESLGECGSCGKLQPVDSISCTDCGVSFVSEETVDQTEEDTVEISVDEANEILAEEEEADDSEEEDEADDSEEEDEADDSEEEDEADDSEEADEADGSEEADEADGSEEAEEEVDNTATVMAFESLALAIAEAGMTAAEAFSEMDSSNDNLVDAPELQKGIEKICGEKLSPSEITSILEYLDTNENNRIDSIELIKALEDLKIGIKPGKMPKVKKKKEFPSDLQKFLMGKKANDIFYPIAYFLMVAFIGCWVVNGIGLIVDGTGGTVVYDGHNDGMGEVDFANWNICESDVDPMLDPCFGSVVKGDTYPCDPTIDPSKCANSLTPFSGENASSMPAGFYTDGIMMIVLGVIGLAIVAYLHLVYAPALRSLAKGESPVKDDEDDESDDADDDDESDDADDDESDDADDDESDDADDDESDDADDESDDADDDDESDDADDDESDDDDSDGIDVGDWVGIEIDGEEFFGEIIEFDDEENTVTIETEDEEEVTGDQDDMFLDDEDEDDE